MATDRIIGSVGVQIVPNATGFRDKVRALTQGLIADVQLTADTAKASAELDEAAHDRDSEIHADADTAEANAKLDRAARTRKATILPDVSGLGVLTTGLLTLGPALVPITAAATGLTAALGAPLLAAGGGATLYGLIAGKTVKDTQKQSKAIDQLKAKVDAAQVSVSKATTPAGKKSAMATLATDTKAYNDALAKLDPEQRKFIAAEGQLGTAFGKLSQGAHVLGPITSALGLLDDVMPKLKEPLASVTESVGSLLAQAETGVRHGALNGLLDFVKEWNGPAIREISDVTWNVASGIGSIVKESAGLGNSALTNIDDWSKGFAHIGESKGFEDFLGYVHREGPEVAHTLDDVGSAAGHIVKAVAPIGDLSLKTIDALAKGVSKIPTGILTDAAGSIGLIAVGLKGISLANKGIGVLNKVPGISIGGKSGGLTTVEGALGKAAAKGVVPVYVTNEGFGGPGKGGPIVAGGAGAAEKGAAGAVEKGATAGILARLGARLAPLARIFGEAAPGVGWGVFAGTTLSSMGLNPLSGETRHMTPVGPTRSDVRDRRDAAEATKQQAVAQASLNHLLAAPALSDYGKTLRSLPKDVQTKIETPGAVESGKDIAKLANQYNLTPKQVKTVVNLLGQEGALRDVTKLGRAYGLTPKQVRTLISQSGMDSSQAAIRRLAQLYDLTPRQVQTLISARDSATSVIARIKSELAHIPRSISTQVFVNRTTAYNKPRSTPGNPGGSADGSTVPKLGPYVDRYPYLLAPGEEVISNRHGQADRHRALLKAINAGRLADGGTVTKKKKPNVLTQAEFNQAAYAFDLSLPMTIRQIDSEFHSLATTIHRDSGHLSDALGKLRKSAIGLVDPFSTASKRLSTARSEKSSAISTAVGSFNNDLFSGGLGDFLTGAHADINDITGMMSAIGKARKKGLSGPLAAALEGSGNVALAQQFAGASRSQISYYEHLFATRANDQASLGKQAGSFYDPAIAKFSAEVAHLRDAINRYEKAAQAQIAAANKLPHAVHEGARDGTREGNDARDKRGANRRKTR